MGKLLLDYVATHLQRLNLCSHSARTSDCDC